MACIDKSYWIDTKIIFKNAVSCAKTKETRALFLLMSSPFILTKVFPENKLKNWAKKCGLIRKNSSDSETCSMSMDYLDFVTDVVSTFCLLMEMMDTDVRETSRQLQSIRSVESGINIIVTSAVYHHLRTMLPYKNDEKKFPGLIVILVYMYDKILFQIEDPMKLEKLLQMSDESKLLRLQGNELFKDQKFRDAIELYTSAIKGSPYTAALYSNRSIAHLKIKSHQQALRDARLALIINPMWPKVYYRLAEVIEQISSPDDAFEVVQNGLRHCAIFNLTGKEVELLDKYNSSLRPKVKMTLWNGECRHSRFSDLDDAIFMEDNISMESMKSSQELIRNYSMLLDKALSNEHKMVNEDVYMLKLCLSLALTKNYNQEELNKSLSLAESLVSNSTRQFQMLGYFIISSVLYQLFRFKECKVAADCGYALLLEEENEVEVLYWVNSNSVPIDITLPNRLLKGFEDFIHLCDNPIPPIATCRYEATASNIKRRYHGFPEIYEQEPEYKGYIQLTCTEKCNLQYHTQCWKYLKEDTGQNNEKLFLGSECLTPDCTAAIFKVYLMFKDPSKIKSFELSKEEALKKLEQKILISNNNNNGAEDLPKTKKNKSIAAPNGEQQPSLDKDDLVLELRSKVESLSQQVNQVFQEAKENKLEIDTHKATMEKFRNERKKFNEEVKAFKNEQKAWKNERLKFEQELSSMQNSVEVMNSVIESERSSKQDVEMLYRSAEQRCEEANAKSKECQISCLTQNRELGMWILSWAVSLAELKVNYLLENNNAEEVVKLALNVLQQLSDKKEAFHLSLNEEISNVRQNGGLPASYNMSIPVSMDMISSLLKDVLTASQNSSNEAAKGDDQTFSQPISSFTSSSASPEPNGLMMPPSNKPSIPPIQYFEDQTSFFVDSIVKAQNFRQQNNQKNLHETSQNPNLQLSTPRPYPSVEATGAARVYASDDASDNNESSSSKSYQSNSTHVSDFFENIKLEKAIYCKTLEENLLSPEKISDNNTNLGTVPKQSIKKAEPVINLQQKEPEWKGAAKRSNGNGDPIAGLCDLSPINTTVHAKAFGNMSNSSTGNAESRSPYHEVHQKNFSKFKDDISIPPNGEDKKWKVVGGPKLNAQAKVNQPIMPPFPDMIAAHAQPNIHKITHRQKLFSRLLSVFPERTDEELEACIQEVRRNNNNSLTGISMDIIVFRVGQLLKSQQDPVVGHRPPISKISEIGMCAPASVPAPPKPAPTAPWVKQAQNLSSKWQPNHDEHRECAICQEGMNSSTLEKLDCGHSFHKQCIMKWLNEHKSCPVCRQLTLSKDEFPTLA